MAVAAASSALGNNRGFWGGEEFKYWNCNERDLEFTNVGLKILDPAIGAPEPLAKNVLLSCGGQAVAWLEPESTEGSSSETVSTDEELIQWFTSKVLLPESAVYKTTRRAVHQHDSVEAFPFALITYSHCKSISLQFLGSISGSMVDMAKQQVLSLGKWNRKVEASAAAKTIAFHYEDGDYVTGSDEHRKCSATVVFECFDEIRDAGATLSSIIEGVHGHFECHMKISSPVFGDLSHASGIPTLFYRPILSENEFEIFLKGSLSSIPKDASYFLDAAVLDKFHALRSLRAEFPFDAQDSNPGSGDKSPSNLEVTNELHASLSDFEVLRNFIMENLKNSHLKPAKNGDADKEDEKKADL